MDNYLKKSFLGQGSFSKVFLVEEKATKRQLAMKVIDAPDGSDIKDFTTKVNLMKKLATLHPNIAQYEDSFYDKNEHVFVILRRSQFNYHHQTV